MRPESAVLSTARLVPRVIGEQSHAKPESSTHYVRPSGSGSCLLRRVTDARLLRGSPGFRSRSWGAGMALGWPPRLELSCPLGLRQSRVQRFPRAALGLGGVVLTCDNSRATSGNWRPIRSATTRGRLEPPLAGKASCPLLSRARPGRRQRRRARRQLGAAPPATDCPNPRSAASRPLAWNRATFCKLHRRLDGDCSG